MYNICSLEIHASYHCNLSCRNCMHMSPLEHMHTMTEVELEEDLEHLKGIIHVEEIRLLGGEPLLNPKLADLVKIARNSGIGSRISISTNGIQLKKWGKAYDLWRNVDQCEVSIYASEQIDEKEIVASCEALSEEYGIPFYVYYCNLFREVGSFDKCNDINITKRVFDSCIIRRTWQCYNLFEGRLYLCPQSIGFSRNNPNVDIESNSVSLKSNSLEKDLGEFFSRKEPLPACSYCYGCIGKMCHHEQIARYEFLSDFITGYHIDSLDAGFLEKIEKSEGKGFLSLGTIGETKIISKKAEGKV